ncbi:HNH endonuclease [Serinibacter salmoneus]|uniref:HNH endonuclease n=1 Tax=Serinibacter salmoneus TaxID=556530 RepID=A0A2A9CYZ7_9MICO|nr:HNH endonuclease signature motif containing protein [Serinibacter salmoneus]PFG19654.1 HNH endonuclease [Serinibacter salmoneus]
MDREAASGHGEGWPGIGGHREGVADLLAAVHNLTQRIARVADSTDPTDPAVSTGLTDPAVSTGLTWLDPSAALVEAISALESLKSAACAAQARLSAQLADRQRGAQRDAGVPAAQVGVGIAHQVALARGVSPSQGSTLLGVARALSAEMPCTMRALSTGRIDEWRAIVLVRESACLSVEDRMQLDREVCGDPEALVGVGARRLGARARRVAQRLDAASLVARARKAERDRTVTIRPAPDTMVYLTALLPVAQGVSAYAALDAAAAAARAAGDARGRGQVMADTLVERLTGRAAAAPVPVGVNLVMTDAALLAPPGTPGRDEPAGIVGSCDGRLAPPPAGIGPLPAGWARELVAAALDGSTDGTAEGTPGGTAGRSPDPATAVTLRRLFTEPTTGELLALESRSRVAPPGLRRFVVLRDGTCRTPYCDAAIRHTDHAHEVARGGPTTAENLQGLCERCNYAKQAPGWAATVGADASGVPRSSRAAVGAAAVGAAAVGAATGGSATASLRTPTGHVYRSRPDPLPGATSPPNTRQAALGEPAGCRWDRTTRRVPGTRAGIVHLATPMGPTPTVARSTHGPGIESGRRKTYPRRI